MDAAAEFITSGVIAGTMLFTFVVFAAPSRAIHC